MGQRAAALEAAVVAYGDQDGEMEGIENKEDKEWCHTWWLRLLKPIVAEEALEAKAKSPTKDEVATIIESQESEPGHVTREIEDAAEIDKMVAEEHQLRREVQRQQEEFDKQRWGHELALHEEDLQNQQDHDNSNWEIMKEMEASRVAQEWDDWVIWDAMRNGPPSPKRQRLVMHVRLEADNVVQEKFTLWTRPNMPVTMGLTWSVDDDMPPGQATPASSSAATQMVTPTRVKSECSEQGVSGGKLRRSARVSQIAAEDESSWSVLKA